MLAGNQLNHELFNADDRCETDADCVGFRYRVSCSNGCFLDATRADSQAVLIDNAARVEREVCGALEAQCGSPSPASASCSEPLGAKCSLGFCGFVE